MKYIWKNDAWPNFIYDDVSDSLVRLYEEKNATDIAFSVIDDQTRRQMIAADLSQDMVSSLSIEGEAIDIDSVYSSVSKHLDVMFTGKSKDSAYAQSVLSMVTDALENHGPLTHQRLCDWNLRLFENKAGLHPKVMGEYRNGAEYFMKVSGKSQEIVYEAVRPENVPMEMGRFLEFVNGDDALDPFVKASIASLWFVAIHPFEDGNGRISRAIADYVINRSSNDGLHVFNLSSGILMDRDSYYDHIQVSLTDNPSMDISGWVVWFLDMVCDCFVRSRSALKKTLSTTSFMKSLDPNEFNSREMSMLYKLADGSFFGKLTTEKWMEMTKSSKTVAFRDIQHLVKKGFLIPSNGAGRNAGYHFNDMIVQ